jgi:hypothetical protein
MRIRLNASLLGASLALTSLTIPGFGATQEAAVQKVMLNDGIDPAQSSAGSKFAEDVSTPVITAEGIAPTQPAASAEADEYIPMTDSERLRDYLTGTFGTAALEKTAASAEMMQLQNIPIEWGKSPAKYGVRLGSAFAQHFIRGTLQYGVSSALHEDNRYQRSGKKGFWKRTRYAISGTFLARHPNGRRSFSFSRIGSAGGAAFISRAWLPQSIATVGAGTSSFGLTIAFDVGSNVFREFWPDLKKHFRRS